MTDPTSVMRTELDGPCEVLHELTQEEAATLLSLIACAKQRNQRSLDAAIDDVLAALPRLIRIPARTLLFGR
jgi:hypothetical protein